MYTVRQIARALQVSDTAVRQWTSEFSEHLSGTAAPPKGQARAYTEDDVGIFKTVVALRMQGVSLEEIHQQLNQGIRLEPVIESAEDAPAGDKSPETAVAIRAFGETLRTYETRLDALTDRLIEAEKRAAAAETEVKILREMMGSREGEGGKRPSFWQRIRGE